MRMYKLAGLRCCRLNGRIMSRTPTRSCWAWQRSKIMLKNRYRPAAKLAGIVGPDTAAPIPEATGLGHEQVVKSVTVAVVGWINAARFFGEQGARLFHGAQNVAVASHPREIISPASAFHMKAAVFLSQFLNDLIESLSAALALEPVPNPFLHDRLDGGEVLLANSQGIEIFQVFGDIYWGRIGTGSFAHDLQELGRELVHHDTAVLTIRNLGC